MAGLSGSVLPVHPQPKDDEIFSSWLCRISQANGLKLHTLEVQLWGREKQIWTRDIDRTIDADTLNRVASVCGTPLDRANETTLRALEGKLFEKLLVGNSPWVIPAAIYHRTRRRPFMQFCSRCLATDKIPFYRRSWRLALSTFCDEHDVMLRDSCPECKAPIMFYRQEMGQRYVTSVESLSLCTSCGFDLRTAKCEEVNVVDAHALATLRLQIRSFALGWTYNDKYMFQYGQLYFDVLRNLMQKLMSPWTIQRLRHLVEEKFSLPPISRSRVREPFEYFGVNDRHQLLQVATWLLMEWPTRFQSLFREKRCRYSELMREFDNAPYWFQHEAGKLEHLPLGASPGEVDSMRKLLAATEDTKRRKQLQHIMLIRLGRIPLDKFLHGL